MVANLDMVHWATRANQNVLLTHQKSVTGGAVRPTDRFGATRRTSLPQWPVGRSIGPGVMVGHDPIPGWRRKAFSTPLPWAFDSSRGWRLPERPGGMGIARSTRTPMARVDGDPAGDRPAGGATRQPAPRPWTTVAAPGLRRGARCRPPHCESMAHLRVAEAAARVGRAHSGDQCRQPPPDFLFPQQSSPGSAPCWTSNFLVYMCTSFTNATAFSPTDTMPLTAWAKLLMMLQSLASLLTVSLVISRAVNILG